jgi:fatty aldehyde-generating acyl-ACP reductase
MLPRMNNSPRDYALIGHLDSFARYRWFFSQLRETDKEALSDAELRSYINAMPPSRVAEIYPVEGALGRSVRGCYIDCYFDPESLEDLSYMRLALRKVKKACELAARLGVGIVSLGGFTSILGELSKESHPLVIGRTSFTTGNTLTCYATLQGIIEMTGRRGRNIEDARVLVIGATGDIGSGCTRWLNGRVRHLDLIARDLNRLEEFVGSLPSTRTAIKTHQDLTPAASKADIVIAVANTLSNVFDPSIFDPGAVICDVGYPKNFKTQNGSDGPVIFYGGMVRGPGEGKVDPSFLMEELYPDLDVIQGCLAEAALLAMAGRMEPFSYGRGNITPEKIDEIGSLFRAQGFSVARPHNEHGYLYPEDSVAPYAKEERFYTTPVI